MKKILFILSALFSVVEAKADSPLTSTIFYTAYETAEPVKNVLANGFDTQTLNFLGSKKGSSIEKLAVINAISWGNQENVKTFEEFLLANRKGLKKEVFEYLRAGHAQTEETKQTKLLSADDLMCWAYLQAMGNYFEPGLALSAATLAEARKPKSMSHSVCLALIIAQIDFDISWCRVYLNCQGLIVEKKYSENVLSVEGVEGIMSYIRLYEGDCQ